MSKSDSTAPIGTKYRLPDGCILFVRQSFMGTWKAFYRVLGKTKSGKDRTKETSFRAKCLPWRETFEEAQADLDAAVASGQGPFKGAKAVIEKSRRVISFPEFHHDIILRYPRPTLLSLFEANYLN